VFGNPVAQAFIRPPGSPFIIGSFRVTLAFGVVDAQHPSGHGGMDLGNGKCGEPLLAMADGEVSLAGFIGSSKVVRIVHPQFPGFESAAAHMASIEAGISKGVTVKRGQRIGTLGATGASACHDHVGVKLNGVSVDPWPLLDQNQETDMLQGTTPVRVVNRQVAVKANNTRFRPSPGTAESQLAMFKAGTLLFPDYLVQGGLANGTRGWYGGWGVTARGVEFGYLHESVVTAPVPIEPTV